MAAIIFITLAILFNTLAHFHPAAASVTCIEFPRNDCIVSSASQCPEEEQQPLLLLSDYASALFCYFDVKRELILEIFLSWNTFRSFGNHHHTK